MSRILIAWELGGNYGHFVRCLRIALALRERGYDVVFAVRDTRNAAEILGKAGFLYCQAPHAGKPMRLAGPPASFSEMLIGEGYADPLSLRGMAQAWTALFHLFRPDSLLADHAPAALLAAHVASIPALPIGNGFTVPRQTSPQPSIRPWEHIPESRLALADRAVDTSLQTVAKALGYDGKRALTLATLYGGRALLNFFPEFDHFGERPGGNYIGPIFSAPAAQRVEWQGIKDNRVLAYMRPEVKGFEPLMQALRDFNAESVVVAPGLSDAHALGIAAPNLRIFRDAIDFSGLLPQTDIMINQGGIATMAESLLAGVPMLLLPHHVEQYLASRRVNGIGASVLCEPSERTTHQFSSRLDQLTGIDAYRANAEAFASKYAGFDIRTPVQKAVAELEELVGIADQA